MRRCNELCVSGLICFQYSIVFALLFFVHFFGWKYNSPRLLICHSVSCTLLSMTTLTAVLGVIFFDLYNGSTMNLPSIRHQIQVGIIEACISLPLFVIFGATSWFHAERGRNFSIQRRRFLFSMKALGKIFNRKLSILGEGNPINEIKNRTNPVFAYFYYLALKYPAFNRVLLLKAGHKNLLSPASNNDQFLLTLL